MFRLILGVLALLGASRLAFAAIDPLIEKAEALMAEEHFAEVVELLTPHAASPTADVAFELAFAHMNLALEGAAKEQVDSAEIAIAIEWAERARALGNASGANLLYMIYSHGYGVPVDMPKALEFLREAVDHHEPGAMTNYALMLYSGTPEVPRDRDLAAKYFFELVKRDKPVPIATYYVGVIKYRGEAGQRKDAKGAMKLIRRAAEQGVGEAQRDVGRDFEYGWTVKANLKSALDWYERAAENGESWAQWRIGMAFVKGEGRRADPIQAVTYFQESADAGDKDGLTSLAVMYATGEGVGQDFVRARELYEEAADAGSVHALKNLAGMYARGEGVEVDLVQSYVLCLQAEERGDEEAVQLRKETEAQLTPDQLAEARSRLAR
jgi:TPR repeat protein